MTLKFILIGRRLYNSTQIIAIPPIMPDLDSDITIAKINSKANNCITNIQNLEEIDFIHNNIKGKPIQIYILVINLILYISQKYY